MSASEQPILLMNMRNQTASTSKPIINIQDIYLEATIQSHLRFLKVSQQNSLTKEALKKILTENPRLVKAFNTGTFD